jgi:two-component system LytT family sensor kinase
MIAGHLDAFLRASNCTLDTRDFSLAPHAMMLSARGFLGDWTPGEPAAAVSQLIAGAIMAFLLFRFVRKTPWPRPFRFRFVLLHIVVAIAFGVSFIALTIAIESVFTGSLLTTRTARRVVELPSELPLSALLLYSVVLGIVYSVERRARSARVEAEAVRAQLAALRAQLHPHFLFNALHAVVQLIPIDPDRAVEAAELVASLLRVTVEENRDEVTLDDEWRFVSRYLELERIRFGDRLLVRTDVDPDMLEEWLPSFSVQTLVENAVRHGVSHRAVPTQIIVNASRTDSKLRLSVWNEGDHLAPDNSENGAGTGLSRLRERLGFLYGDAAELKYGTRDNGFEAILVVPRRSEA